jgi:hypothetical protein
VAGIVTDRDLFIALGTNNRNAGNLLEGTLMEKELCTCAPGDDIRTALKGMAQRQVQRLPVVDTAGALKGILSIDDIVLRADADGLSNEDVLTAIKAIWGRQNQRKAGHVQRSAPQPVAAQRSKGIRARKHRTETNWTLSDLHIGGAVGGEQGAGDSYATRHSPREGVALHKKWGEILAGGDGVRLRPLTKIICGDDHPKKFCPFFDGTTFAHTLRRAEHCSV